MANVTDAVCGIRRGRCRYVIGAAILVFVALLGVGTTVWWRTTDQVRANEIQVVEVKTKQEAIRENVAQVMVQVEKTGEAVQEILVLVKKNGG